MKKYLITAIILALAPVAFAEVPVTVNKEVVCTNPSTMFSAVRTMYGEYPIWHGDADGEGSVVITANPTTNSWSIIKYNEKVACLLEIGKEFQFRDSKKLKL
jgi:hypothetical protein